MTDLWLTITIIGAVTYATRVIPLFGHRLKGLMTQQSSWRDRLGPCLLASMAVAVILPTFASSASPVEMCATSCGLLATSGSMWFRRDPGLATLLGMITFYIVSVVEF